MTSKRTNREGLEVQVVRLHWVGQVACALVLVFIGFVSRTVWAQEQSLSKITTTLELMREGDEADRLARAQILRDVRKAELALEGHGGDIEQIRRELDEIKRRMGR